MASSLRILHLEADPLAAERILQALSKDGLAVSIRRVQSREDFQAELRRGGIDLILADYQLPNFDGLSAQKLATEMAPHIPLIFVSGTIGEDRAIEVVKNGAVDYVLKDRLDKLGSAVRRATKEVAERAEHQRVENELRESERRFRQLAENATDIIFSKRPGGKFTYVSPACANLLGYDPRELIGTDFYKLVHPEDIAAIQRVHESILSKQDQQPGIVTHRLCNKNGKYKWFETTSRAAADLEGHAEIHGISRDITERKDLERQLMQAQKMEAVGQLAGGIAHDFNNLLTVILGRTDLMIAQMQSDNPLRPKLDLIQTTAQRAACLTRQLLAFSRRQILDPQVVDINQIIKSMTEMLLRLIGEDITLSMVLDENLRRIKADPSQIEQVIVNLAVNSRDAMPRGGKLIVESANVDIDEEYARTHIGVAAGRYIMLAVSDTGVGMTAEVKSHIFEPFFTTKEMGKGTGLGLSTIYGIVKQSGGQIFTYSEPGHGTTIKVYLPATDESPGQSAKTSHTNRAVATETILVVEDEADVRQLVEDVLTESGYKVITAANGSIALQQVQHFADPVHLLLTDVVMPEMSGADLATEIKKLKPELKVLYMSGYPDNSLGERGVLKTGFAFIHKPFTHRSLAKKIRDVLDRE